ncbi:hypothetical protein EXIGLDRAFT_836338 [Exidia glandulosa HHB12029]|uniref:Uncharacterized protein n=1 Tax=Exidia glandulosa HHB12029 TaxID=1314781 RepID=A0A165HW23_EXIGL|nr:hypothetical protein EXIGLDRAFT_836338 [Exidia glandulosa HHB12029]
MPVSSRVWARCLDLGLVRSLALWASVLSRSVGRCASSLSLPSCFVFPHFPTRRQRKKPRRARTARHGAMVARVCLSVRARPFFVPWPSSVPRTATVNARGSDTCALRDMPLAGGPDALPNPDDYTSSEEFIPGLPTRQLKFTHRMVEQRWFEAYKEDIVRAYSDWDFKDMMLVSTIVVRQSLPPIPPPEPSKALVLDIFLDNLPPDMRDSILAELSIGSGRQHAA